MHRSGTGKGALPGGRDDQVVLRRDSLRADPALIDDRRQFVVLGIANTRPDLRVYTDPSPHGPARVRIAWLTWAELARCEAHPLAAEFRRYLEWKRDLAL